MFVFGQPSKWCQHLRPSGDPSLAGRFGKLSAAVHEYGDAPRLAEDSGAGWSGQVAGGIQMIRHAAAVAVALCLSPSWLCAQTEFTVNVDSANVRKSPSTGSPVIGTAPRGTVLEVTRDIGAWVKVSWPDAQDGIGYVHQSMGAIARRSTPDPKQAAAFTSTPPPAESASPTTIGVAAVPTGAGGSPASTRTVYIAPPTHIVGLGGRMGGSTLRGFGLTARAWSRNRLGMQLEVSRSALTSTVAPGRVTSLQFAPSLIYSLPDRVTDNVWVRPYLGAGANLYRSTLRSVTPGAGDVVSDGGFGLRAFGGGEVTFPNVPRFAVSADVGYLWSQTAFAGFELGGLGFSVSGHWYVK